MSKTSEYELAKYPVLVAPFHGAPVPVKVRELTQAQIYACGNFSLIETFEDSIKKKSGKFTTQEILAYTDRNHEIVKAALVDPTYDELIAAVGQDKLITESKRKLDELDERTKTLAVGCAERTELEGRIDSLRIWIDLILPEDFMSFVVCYSLGVNKTEIKKVSEEMLINAATLAELGHDNPADHLHGLWEGLPNAQFYKDDINTRAWILLNKSRREKRSA
jgi:hypothetical protein